MTEKIELYKCPNCDHYNPPGREKCFKCKVDLKEEDIKAAAAAAKKRQRTWVSTVVVAAIVLVALLFWWFMYGQPDKDPPIVTVESPLPGAFLGGNEVEVRGVIEDRRPDKVLINGQPAERDGNNFKGIASLTDGENEIKVMGMDRDGNQSDVVTLKVTVDAAPPEFVGLIPEGDMEVTAEKLEISGEASEELKSFSVNDEKGTVDGMTFRIAAPLVMGENRLKVVIEDKAGNKTERELVMTRIERVIPEEMSFKATNKLGYDEFIGAKDGATMVMIPEGAFSMGSESGDADENPVHTVTVSAFLIDRNPVTNEQYKKFCDETGQSLPADPGWGGDYQNYMESLPEYPVVNVSWNDAVKYAEWAGKRLPTEAEWERASAGDGEKTYPWGEDPPMEGSVPRACFEGEGDGFRYTCPAGKFLNGASQFGVLDTVGNVWEWCGDYYSSRYYASSPESDPPGPSSGAERVVRGGSHTSGADSIRTTNRWKYSTGTKRSNLGFRCARDYE